MSIPRTLWIFRKSAFFVFLVYTGYFCEGFELQAGGLVIANRGFINQFGTNAAGTGVGKLDPTWVSTWSAFLNVGQIVTFTYISWFADKFGRKMSFYLAYLWLIVGVILLNTAKSPPVWAIAKLCNGAGIGILQIVCQVYVMEICPNRIRGGMETFQGLWSNIGNMVVAIMMQQLNKNHPENYLLAMRILFAPVGVMIFFWAFIPESPWWYARKGNRDGAMKSLQRLYGNVPGYDLEEEYGIIVHTIEHERTMLDNRPRFRHVFQGTNLRRTLTVMILAVTQQFAGLAIISTYSSYFFSLAGLADPFLGSLILSCVNTMALIVWVLSVDKLGRRWFVAVGQTIAVFSCFTVGALWYTGASSGNAAAGTALLFICCVWTFSFQFVAKSYYLYSAEIPSAVLRIKTGPVTFFTNSITGIATCYATPPLLLALNLRAGFVYGALSVPMCILVWLYIPETKGRSAAEIDELYEKKVPAWRWNKYVTEAEGTMHQAIAAKGRVGQA